MARHLIAAAVLFVTMASSVLAQQRDAPPPQPLGTGRISGTVVGSESGRPVRFATVTLSSGAGEFRALTDDAGGFSIGNLPAGMYAVSASKSGFVDTTFGQIRPGTTTAGTRVKVEPRQHVEQFVVRLAQGGSISGTVRDDRGDPVFGATVQVGRWVFRNGKRTLETVGARETDERGMYRFPLLPSRQYVVSAVPSDNTSSDVERKREQGFAPAFHPNALSVSGAETIALGVDEHRSSVDVVVPLVRLSRVTGIVLDSDGKPAPGIEVSLGDTRLEDTEQMTTSGPDGRFEFERIAPGPYVLRAGARSGLHSFSVEYKHSGDDVSYSLRSMVTKLKADIVLADKVFVNGVEPPADEMSAAAAGSATTEISVSGDRMPDVVMRLEPPRVVAGRVVFEGAKAPATFKNLGVSLEAMNGHGQIGVEVGDDGAFAIERVQPGKYLVRMKAPSPWNLGSAVSGGLDTLDSLLEVPRGRDIRDLTLTLRDKVTELSGLVTNPAGDAVDNRMVVAFPADERFWNAGPGRLQSANLGSDGHYSFMGLRPGDYRIAVVGDVEDDEWMDPQFLRQLIAASVPVTLGEAERKTQDLRVK